MRVRVLASGVLAVAALASAGCGNSSPRVLLTLTADAPITSYDLYVRRESPRERLLHTNFSAIDRDITMQPLKVGLTLPSDGDWSIGVVGAIGPTAGAHVDWTASMPRQFYAAQTVHASGDSEITVHLAEVKQPEDGDGDGIPSAAWTNIGSTPMNLVDCNDADPTINPFVERDICSDGIDQDCDGKDATCDQDGDGDPDQSDCAPTDPKIHHPNPMDPYPETPNCCGYNLGKTGADARKDFSSDPICHPGTCGDGVDEDCDGVDVACVTDKDCDGSPAGVDCDDNDPNINPNAPEVCDGKDNNCNGLVDETCVGCDLDGDGYERMDPQSGCPDSKDQHPGMIDCNDHDRGVFPGSTDGNHPVAIPSLKTMGGTCNNGEANTVCAALRQTCKWPGRNVPVDIDCDGQQACPPANCDADGDGFQKNGCGPGPYDCDDADPFTFPGAPEKCGDGKSQSCSQDVACAADADGDGYNSDVDCNDGDPKIHPWATELCNGIDDDCDGLTDEGNPDGTGNPMVNLSCTDSNVGACASPAGSCVCSSTSLMGLHVDDTSRTACPTETAQVDSASTPGARCYGAAQPTVELCDGIDNDCNPATTDGASDTCPSACCGASGCADNAQNCGMCGKACNLANAVPQCTNMMCAIMSCDPGFQNCDNQIANGCEIDLNTDVNHCGSCTKQCSTPTNATSAACSGGNCAVGTCKSGWADCNMQYGDGCETNTTSDVNNCSTCGMQCTVANGTAKCAMSTCQVNSCNTGFGDCNGQYGDGCETNVTSDPNNCSKCGMKCGAVANGSPGCANSACTPICNSGFGDCDNMYGNGCETDLTSSTMHCGSCTNNCAGKGDACTSGTCTCGGGTACTGTSTVCCGGNCLKPNGASCSSNGQCCSGNCHGNPAHC